jgi:hypothetical protein
MNGRPGPEENIFAPYVEIKGLHSGGKSSRAAGICTAVYDAIFDHDGLDCAH